MKQVLFVRCFTHERVSCSMYFYIATDNINISTSSPNGTIEGQRFELRCAHQNTSINTTSITWSRNNVTLNSTTDMGAEILTFDPVMSSDAGTYICSYGDLNLSRPYDLIPLPGRCMI